MRTIIAILISALAAASAHAAPQDFFGGPPDPAMQAVTQKYVCDDIRESSGYWTCQTKINVGQGIGLVDLHVQVRHLSAPLTGGVVAYIFDIPKRRLIRDTSFRGLIGFAGFFGEDVARTLNTRETYSVYVRGQDVFEVGDLLFEVSETSSSVQFTVQSKSHPNTRQSIIANLAPDPDSCRQSDGLPGWELSWSDKYSSIEPALRPVSTEYDMVAGQFNISKGEVTPSFRKSYWPGQNEDYVTLFVDKQPVYQGQWIKITEPTCCSLSLKKKFPLAMLLDMPPEATAIIMVSADPEGKRVIAASSFDPSNIREAVKKVTVGRLDRILAKEKGTCR